MTEPESKIAPTPADTADGPASAPAPAAPADAASGTKPAAGDTAKGKSNAVWMGTAVGVGSAALVAALMYAKRRK
jgi:hypothetical protein